MNRVFAKIFLILAVVFTPAFFIHAEEPIKILLVPGHDEKIWGAQFALVKEANMNYAVARRIKNILEDDERFKVFITREGGSYTNEFANYFTSEKDSISAFRKKARDSMKAKIEEGKFVEKRTVPHNKVTEDMANILYGINKWANENKIDAVIHIHFNDYPRKTRWTIGKYTGFAIYFPDGQLKNGESSRELAGSIFTELGKKYDTSTYAPESAGLIPSQKLIAIGASGTLDESVRSVLIEYGYIYEKKFRSFISRHKAYDDMADLTSFGIRNYFFREP